MKKSVSFVFGMVLISALIFSTHDLCAQSDSPNANNVKAATPEKIEEGKLPRFQSQVEAMQKGEGKIDLLMIGDSITQGWENAGKNVWGEYYAHRKPINLGISGDRTEHVLWRLENMPLDLISPKAAVVMIGTNNLGSKMSPSDTAQGIAAVVEKLRWLKPQMKIIVLKVFPRDKNPDGNLRQKVNELNEIFPPLVEGIDNVQVVDINDSFLEDDGTISNDVMPDKLHLSENGYKFWARALEPVLEKTLDEKNPAVIPVDRSKQKVWWQPRHDACAAEMEKGKAKFLLIGDSITHLWEQHPDYPKTLPKCPGFPDLVEKYFGKYAPLNLGFCGDQTQNVLWRLDNLPLRKIQPKMAMIMIGTNNMRDKNNTPYQIACGIRAIVERLQTAYPQDPQIKILVLDIFPREKPNTPIRYRVAETNACINELLKEYKNVERLDIGEAFMNDDGNIPTAVFYDTLHPDREGFIRWGNAVAPKLAEMFQ